MGTGLFQKVYRRSLQTTPGTVADQGTAKPNAEDGLCLPNTWTHSIDLGLWTFRYDTTLLLLLDFGIRPLSFEVFTTTGHFQTEPKVRLGLWILILRRVWGYEVFFYYWRLTSWFLEFVGACCMGFTYVCCLMRVTTMGDAVERWYYRIRQIPCLGIWLLIVFCGWSLFR